MPRLRLALLLASLSAAPLAADSAGPASLTLLPLDTGGGPIDYPYTVADVRTTGSPST